MCFKCQLVHIGIMIIGIHASCLFMFLTDDYKLEIIEKSFLHALRCQLVHTQSALSLYVDGSFA